MKKIFATLLSVVLAGSLCMAQDLAQATELYNAGATALAEGDKQVALDNFNKALEAAITVGETADGVKKNCQDAIPQVMVSIAKDLIKAKDFDGALEMVNNAIAKAEEFGASAEKAAELLPTIAISKGNELLSAKDYAGAIEQFSKALELDPQSAVAAVKLGQAYDKAGNYERAIEALTKASELGQTKNAEKILSGVYTKMANGAYSEKNFENALEYAIQALGYGDNANAAKIGGNAAAQLGNKEKAIELLKKYLALSPTAKDAAAVTGVIEALSK